jgi:hypothetical protein
MLAGANRITLAVGESERLRLSVGVAAGREDQFPNWELGGEATDDIRCYVVTRAGCYAVTGAQGHLLRRPGSSSRARGRGTRNRRRGNVFPSGIRVGTLGCNAVTPRL